jgi:thiol-disulfide isomerase/thioredoxin
MTSPAPATKLEAAPEGAGLTPWRARTLRRATKADVAYCIAVLALTALALWCGRRAGAHLSPSGARSVSQLLDKLELPRVLPNARLVRDDGTESRLWDIATEPRTIVTFYAPWCAPCQDEVPALARSTAGKAVQLVVVVGPDEDPAEVRKQIDNLGFKDLRFHVDAGRELEVGGRVTALPTTFLIGHMGAVRERIVGYSEFRVQMMLYRLNSGEPVTPDGDGD